MRAFLVPLLLLTAATVVLAAPPASACHVIASNPPGGPVSVIPGYYVVPNVWMDGCPHDVHVCTQVWRESGAEDGLQTTGENADQLIVLVCPYP